MTPAQKLVQETSNLEVLPYSCILWPFCLSSAGYAIYKDKSVGENNIYAHREVLRRYHGLDECPDEMNCLHKPLVCNNPSCINPRHLRWGTQMENCKDRAIDGFSYVGESNKNASLTEADVLEIRSSNLKGVELADIYGVKKSCISKILNNRTWKHI